MRLMGPDPKTAIPEDFLERIRHEAEKIPGFLKLESRTTDGIETTVSYWTSMDAVNEWRRNALHASAKKDRGLYYKWYNVEIDAA